MAADEFKVKGSTIRSKFDFVRERFGEASEQELRRQFPQLATVLDSQWYPFAEFEALLQAIANNFYGSRIEKLVELGEYSAQTALTTIYSAYGDQQTFERMLERISTLHRRLYNLGEMAVERDPAGRACTIRLSGAPAYPPADLQVARGFYLGVARHFGHDATCEMKSGGGGVTFRIAW